MINYRNIFHPNYITLGLIIIIILLFLILLINKDILKSLHYIGLSLIISGIINLIIALIIIVIANIAIPTHYQILINVISINLQNNLLIYSISSIIIGLFLKLVSKIFHKEEIINN